MKKLLIIAITSLLLFPAFSFAAEKELKAQTTCPVMGGKIDKDVYLDYQAQRVYFCCSGCNETFLKDPEKYFKKFQDEGVLSESLQKKCPVMGGDIDKKVFIDHKGRRVYFCCAGCEEKFLANSEKYLKKMK